MKAVRPRDILAKRTGKSAVILVAGNVWAMASRLANSRVSAERAYASEEPGPRGGMMCGHRSEYGASHFFLWVPDLVPLAQVRSLHSSGTRGWHACCCCGVRAPNAVCSLPRLRGRVGVGAGVHRSLRSRSARRQSCCVPPSLSLPRKRGRGRWSRINSRWCSSSAAGAPPCARPAPARSGSGCERRWCP